MSAIDNAFIRAFTTDAGAKTPHAAVRAQRGVSQATTSAQQLASAVATISMTGKQSAISGQSTKPSRPHFARLAPRTNPANAVVPAPHINLATFAHSASTLDDARPQPIPVRIDPPAIARQAPHIFSAVTEASTRATPASREAAAAPQKILPAGQPSTQPPNEPLIDPVHFQPDAPRPAYEVDRFSWPETCDALIARIGTQADELAHELMAEAALGRKIVAISGCSHEEGETTFALLLARRLAVAGAKVAVVDAHFAAPQLAARLGLVIGIGWETVLAMPEKTSLWQTMVESLEDRVTIVPLASRSRLQMSGEIAARVANNLAELRESFDVVLVDAGPLSADQQTGWLAARGNGLDAAILLSDARSAAAGSLSAVSRRFADASIAPLGVAENFCA